MTESLEVLPDDSLLMTLLEGCLQTTMRQAHGALARALLEERETRGPGPEHLDLLAELLVREPFAAIRAAHPDLASATGARVRVFRDGSGRARWARHGAP